MGRYVAKESMSKTLIYGAGLVIVAFVIILLLFLTFENAFSGQATWGTRNGAFTVSGFPAILVNFGILGLVISLVSYILYLFNRRVMFQNTYKYLSLLSGVLVSIGFVLSAT